MSKRPAMLGSVIKKIIAPVLRECPPECGIVSITEITVSRDFSYADVLISALNNPEDAITFLEKKKQGLQRSMSSLYRKRIPTLRFKIDPRTERGGRIDELLKEKGESSDV